jgi:thioredoxin-like negative regulator of GroEL
MNQVQEINENEFDEQVLASKQPSLVAFVAGWSQASERIEPVLKEVAEACSGVVRVFRLDVDDNPDLGTAYGIQSVPTLIFFCDGAVRIKLIGTVSARAVLTKLQLPQRSPASNQTHAKHSKPKPKNTPFTFGKNKRTKTLNTK